MMTVSADFGFQQTEGDQSRGTDVINWYLSRLTCKAHTDGQLADAFLSVLRMGKSPISLMWPGILWRVLKPTG